MRKVVSLEKKRIEKLQKQEAQGKEPKEKTTRNNTKCGHETVEEEQNERLEIIKEHLKIYENIFPLIFKEFQKIEDPRNPKKIEHKLIAALMYSIFLFILKIPSRRQANEILTRPQFIENLNTIFPELEDFDDLPHGDTVKRIFSRIDPEEIQEILVNIVKQLINKKVFDRHKIINGYIVNIDGTQKYCSDYPFSAEALEKEVETKDGKKKQYYVYILEANIIFENGLSIPLLTEFCEFSKDDFENNKQDCELKAFRRLASKLKEFFPRLPIVLNLDGLYPNGPIMRFCREKNWGYMMVLKDDDLKQVWQEAEGLMKLAPENSLTNVWGDREQNFRWANNIEYEFGNNGKYKETVHVVVCEEKWEEVNEEGEVVEKTAKFAWISSEPINKNNVRLRCNKIGRPRWCVEEDILMEKHHGYQSEHLFSTDWNAMRAFHHMMRIARLLDVICHYSIELNKRIQTLGIVGLIRKLRETLTVIKINRKEIRRFLQNRHYMQLIW